MRTSTSRLSVLIRRTARQLIILGCLFSQLANAAALPSFQQVRAQHPSSYATLLDRNGNLLQMLQLNKRAQRLPWVALDDLSPAMQSALLVSEDRRFFQHNGVDWRAVVGAAWENLLYDTHRGASTLTMQLAGLLDPALTRGAGGRTYTQKWQQIKAAESLEKRWSKAQILEAYLNLVNFRADLSGINAAAQALFNKPPATLDTAEAAILAALLRGPNARPAIVAERACGVAQRLQSPRPSCATVTALVYRHLRAHPRWHPDVALAPELALQYLHTPGEQLSTSLDIAIQRLALASLNQQLQPLAGINSGAVLIIANTSAEILAYADAHSDGATATDQIATLHPTGALTQAFLYELAIEQQQLTAASILENTPLPIINPNLFPGYINDASTPAWVSVRYALGLTLAVPARYTLDLVTSPAFSNRLQSLGFSPTNTDQPEQNEANLLSVANAYQSLANHGLFRAASFHIGGMDKTQRLMSTDATAIISNILADPDAHGDTRLTHLRGYAAYTQNQDEYQQWCVGSTGSVTLVVWMGNATHKTITDPDNHAATAWTAIANALNDSLYPSAAPKLPGDLVVANINFVPPIEPPRQEFFIPGIQQTQFSPPPEPGGATYPTWNFAP